MSVKYVHKVLEPSQTWTFLHVDTPMLKKGHEIDYGPRTHLDGVQPKIRDKVQPETLAVNFVLPVLVQKLLS